jgi:quercetin dioxygenase-like cupin family protein
VRPCSVGSEGFGVTAHGNPAFHVVTTGTCWLEVDGEPDQIPLTAGDLVVLPTGRRHWLRDNPATPATELEELLARPDTAMLT